jgi:hypothetical protein
MDSITLIMGSPCVFSLRNDSSSYVHIRKTSATLIDGGANICLTRDLNLLVDIVEIPLLPILVAVHGNVSTLDDSCIHWGYLPLTLLDGSTHWNSAIIARMLWKPSSPLRGFLPQAMSLPCGCRLVSRTVVQANFA